MKKALKITSTIMLVLWSLVVIFGLSFGTGVAKNIIKSVQAFYKETLNTFEIEDVNIDNQIEYFPGKKYVLKYNIKSTNKNKDYELRFKSLNPDVFTVDGAGGIYGKAFSGDIQKGKLEITSLIDKDFKKEIEITFINVSPNSFELIITDLNKQITEFTVGVPFYIYTKFTATNDYNLKTPVYEFNEEYFKKISKNMYLPIKACDEITFKGIIGNTVVERTTKIVQKTLDKDIDEIRFLKSSANATLFEIGSTVYLKFIKNENGKAREAVINYNIRIEDETVVSKNTLDRLTIKGSGTTKIYVDVLDIDGNVIFTKEEEIVIEKNEEPTLPPIVVGPDLSGVPNRIETIENEHKVESVRFPKNAKFENVPDDLTISVDASGAVLRVYSKKVGEYKVVLVAELNGITEKKEITVVVKKDSLLATYQTLMKNSASLVTKIMGHLCLFLIEGVIAIWFIFNNKTKNKWIDVLIYLSVGLSIGLLTEFIQIFLEGRNPALKDVGIDFSGYLIGGAMAIVVIKIALIIWAHLNRNKKTNQIKENADGE